MYKKPNVKKLQKQCDEFNKKYPIGSSVMLKKDFIDEPVKVSVRSEAYVMQGHSAVAFFDGISGCYHIASVRGAA